MSPSEVHASVKRAQASGLFKYAFPAEQGELTRGVATSFGAPPIKEVIATTNDPIPVWPYAEGPPRGVSLAPLYRTAPQAALRDDRFYRLLVIADALRDGRLREREIALEELRRQLRGGRTCRATTLTISLFPEVSSVNPNARRRSSAIAVDRGYFRIQILEATRDAGYTI
jgi:hypothetical protein